MSTVLQGDPFNLQGSAPSVQNAAPAAVVQPAGNPQPATANPQQAAVGIAPRGAAAVFYKPNPNSQQVYNAQGQALSYDQFIAQGGKADFSNVLNTALPGMAPAAAPVAAPTPQPATPTYAPAAPTPSYSPAPSYSAPAAASGATFYKPDPNSQQVYNAQGQPVSYEQFLAQGGKPDFSNVVNGAAPAAAQPGQPGQPGATGTPTQGAQPIPTTPPATATNPTQTRIDQLSKDIFKVDVPSQQKLYEDAYNAAGLGTIRTTLEDLNKRIAAKQEAYTAKEGDINENPFLSEASRVGRLKRLDDQKQAEIGNLLDQYKQYADLYNTGVGEVNDAVTRQIGDFNTKRQVGSEELQYLLGIQKDNKTETADARTFALDNGITQPFYTIDGRTIIRTSDGKAYSNEADWIADGGKPELVQQVKAKTNLKDYPASYQEYLLAQQGGYTGSYTDYQNDDANRKKSIARAGATVYGNTGLTNQELTQVQKVTGQFDNEPIVKNYNIIAEGKAFVDSISNNTQNPADQQGLIYAFAKAMDPNSVVREGEYATVQKYAQSWATSFGFNAARIFSNSPFLSSQAIANMKATINSKYSAAKSQYDNVYSEYGRRVDQLTGKTGGTDFLTNYASYSQPTQGGGSSGVNLDDLFN